MWDLAGKDSKSLDYSSKNGTGDSVHSSLRPDFLPDQSQVRKLKCLSFGIGINSHIQRGKKKKKKGLLPCSTRELPIEGRP